MNHTTRTLELYEDFIVAGGLSEYSGHFFTKMAYR